MSKNSAERPIEACSELLNAQFGIHAVQFDLIAKKEASRSFKVTSDEGQLFFLKLFQDVENNQLEEKFTLLNHLYSARGFDFIVTAIQGENGRFSHPIYPYHLALFPFVEGQPIGSGFGVPEADETAVAAHLAHLHDALYTTSFLPAVPDTFTIRTNIQEWFAPILQALNSQPNLAHLLVDHKPALLAEIGKIEALAKQSMTKYVPSVLVHGNICPSNILKTATGALKLVNWLNFQPAPAERDLFWFVYQNSTRFFSRYANIRMPDYELSVARLDYFYRTSRLQSIIKQCQLLNAQPSPAELETVQHAFRSLEETPDFLRFE